MIQVQTTFEIRKVRLVGENSLGYLQSLQPKLETQTG
jgi:hypothetical protein